MQFGFITKSDKNFFVGLITLISSIRYWYPKTEITVVDCGMTPEQINILGAEKYLRLLPSSLSTFTIPEKMQHYYTSAIYGFFSARDYLYPITIHIDADALVLANLDQMLNAVNEAVPGIAAVTDFPALDLDFQLGELPEGKVVVREIITELDLRSISFNGGVFALSRDYYINALQPWVEKLLPHHTLFWGNDMAVLNLAAFAASPQRPFHRLSATFNTRQHYRRAPNHPANILSYGENGIPHLISAFGPVRILHFIGKKKPWQREAVQDDSWLAWRYYRQLAAEKFNFPVSEQP